MGQRWDAHPGPLTLSHSITIQSLKVHILRRFITILTRVTVIKQAMGTLDRIDSVQP